MHEVRREAVRSLDAAAVIRAICQAVAREHEVRLDAVGLVRPGSIARTTSGKTERHACRRAVRCRPVRIHRAVEVAGRQRIDAAGRRRGAEPPAAAAVGRLGRPATAAAPIDWLTRLARPAAGTGSTARSIRASRWPCMDSIR